MLLNKAMVKYRGYSPWECALLILLLLPFSGPSRAQDAEQLYRDYSTEVRPALAAKGEYPVGVRTITAVNPGQPDLLNASAGHVEMMDREITMEIWYPANASDSHPFASYANETRTGIPFSVRGNARRDTPIATNAGDWPLVVISHGYTGYRSIMFYLAEHLASHGYVVVGIDHPNSTNEDLDLVNNAGAGFLDTLFFRSRDQLFARDYLQQSLSNPGFPLSSRIDNSRSAIIGYSMGGFGALGSIGACYQFSDMFLNGLVGGDNPDLTKQLRQLLNTCAAEGTTPPSVADRALANWQTAILLAPWGMEQDVFSSNSLAALRTPMLFIAGEEDDVSGYEYGIHPLFKAAGSDPKYLLTYENARHNIAAHPAPGPALEVLFDLDHYAEPAWETQRINVINQHFVLAMLNCHMQKQSSACGMLALSGRSNQSRTAAGLGEPWPGFPNRFSTGLRWESR